MRTLVMAILVNALAVGCSTYRAGEDGAAKAAPDLKLEQAGEKGGEVALADLEGSVLVVLAGKTT